MNDLKARGLWTQEIREAASSSTEGSIQRYRGELPEDLRRLYRTAWEVPQKSP